MTGIEPASPAWKAGALAIELHPREQPRLVLGYTFRRFQRINSGVLGEHMTAKHRHGRTRRLDPLRLSLCTANKSPRTIGICEHSAGLLLEYLRENDMPTDVTNVERRVGDAEACAGTSPSFSCSPTRDAPRRAHRHDARRPRPRARRPTSRSCYRPVGPKGPCRRDFRRACSVRDGKPARR